MSQPELSFTFSLVTAHHCEKKGGKKTASERPAELCAKNSSAQQTNALSHLTEEEKKKKEREKDAR